MIASLIICGQQAVLESDTLRSSTLIQNTDNLMLYVKDTHCKHILIGCYHDNGYAPDLDPLKSREILPRISIINHYRPGSEYRDHPFKIAALDGVFREADLTSESINVSSSPDLEPSNPRTKRSRSPSLAPSNTRVQPTAAEYFKVQLNSHGERIDIPIPHVERIKLRAVAQRQILEFPGPCYTHYIFGPGSCTRHCKFSHDGYMELTEVLALAFQGRGIPCKVGELDPIALAIISLTNAGESAQALNVGTKNASMGIIVSKSGAFSFLQTSDSQLVGYVIKHEHEDTRALRD